MAKELSSECNSGDITSDFNRHIKFSLIYCTILTFVLNTPEIKFAEMDVNIQQRFTNLAEVWYNLQFTAEISVNDCKKKIQKVICCKIVVLNIILV